MPILTADEAITKLNRYELIDPELRNNSDLAKVKDKYFRPTTTQHHIYTDEVYDILSNSTVKHDVLKLTLFGTNLIGEKLSVVLDGVDLYVDINPFVNDNIRERLKAKRKNPEIMPNFLNIIKGKLLEKFKIANRDIKLNSPEKKLKLSRELVIKNIEFIKSKDIKLHRKKEIDYIRIYFYNNHDRVAVIDYLGADGWKTYSNEKCKNDISRIVGRLYELQYGSDINIEAAEPYHHKHIKTIRSYIINIKDIKYPSDEEKESYKELFIKRQILLCGFDIEVHGKLGKEVITTDIDDEIKVIGMALYWGDKKAAYISFCYGYLPEDPNIITVMCQNQVELTLTFGKVFGLIQPDHCLDFNGGEYDWSKIRNLLEKVTIGGREILYQFFHDAALYMPKEAHQLNKWDLAKSLYPKKFKLAADLTLDVKMINIPGCIMIDVRNPLRKEFRQMENSSSLRKFLDKINYHLSVK